MYFQFCIILHPVSATAAILLAAETYRLADGQMDTTKSIISLLTDDNNKQFGNKHITYLKVYGITLRPRLCARLTKSVVVPLVLSSVPLVMISPCKIK